MTVQELLLGALYLGAGVIGWFLKDALDSSKATKDSLADFKTEVYVPIIGQVMNVRLMLI